MTKRMLIDASHAEETRVVVLDGNRIDEFDIESENKRPLKGNIYLAKVVRVEPSLQAAFVEYGGNRHGFLAFSEIHPDYYQIPVADRERLLAMQAQEAAEDEDDEDEVSDAEAEAVAAAIEQVADADLAGSGSVQAAPASSFSESYEPEHPREIEPGQVKPRSQPMAMRGETRSASPEELEAAAPQDGVQIEEEGPAPETLGGRDKDEAEEVRGERRIPPRFLRHYKIQEVIRRRQIMLVQVVKEERGNKGAALTTYISLAGRFSVLMPNSPRAGGISRKITSVADRKRLREVIQELGMPRGMSLIVRTAGAGRPKPEILRDCEYLLRLWDDIRERTLESVAPALIYQEADLIKRSIRDLFGRDIEDIQIEGDGAYRQARDFMRMLMPQNERKIRLYRDGGVPLFARHGVEAQLDAMMSPIVQLRSGGYIVINQTEALVAIDVNSGRNTRDRHIEDTALRTNMEAAEEIARQLRLRDLAGLIVIDFIDMESSRNDAQVERRLKEALKNDRARIQVGRISHFGLLEMSRQRLRPSVTEHSFITCAHCQGLGIVRSPESSALQVLRQIEEEGAKRRASEICVRIAPEIAIHLLNRRRDRLSEIEARYGMAVLFEPDAQLHGPAIQIERTRAPIAAEPVAAAPAALRMDYAPEAEPEPVVAVPEAPAAEPAEVSGEAPAGQGEEERGNGNGERRRRRRRRRRGGRREEMTGAPGAEGAEADTGEAEEEGEEEEAEATASAAAEPERAPEAVPEGEEDRRLPRRRGRRGGRRRIGEGTEQPRPTYAGPTPADPFAGTLDDIFDAMAAAEEAAQHGAAARPPALPPVEAEVAAVAPVTTEAPPVTEPGPAVEPQPAAAPREAEPAPEAASAAAVAPEQAVTGTVAAAEAAVAEEVAPAKPRRTRRAKAAAAEVPPEAPAAEAPAAEAPVTEEVAPAKPRRTRRAKAAAEVPAEAPVAEAAVAEEAVPAKPRRPRRAKAASAEVPPEAPAAEAPAAEAPAAEAPAAEAASPAAEQPTAPAAEPAGTAPEAASAEQPQATPPVQPVLVEAAPGAPRKRGWWKR
ncbi:ribonuclease E/G [Roseomonas sp. M0104]|uniref:Ribonuclease E n=2 Tax=Teichococcus coralli TaxID=2545983 RepID=A0A845BCS3_9PROT|nr:ribonuclease E/G [Pseudoroseomonas coralli]MXP65393.1 ribonuclease E/G [Pseudoroseomonas coralli]